MRARWDRFNMIDLFILHFKRTFLRLLVNLITKCFISGHVKLIFIDRFLLTLSFYSLHWVDMIQRSVLIHTHSVPLGWVNICYYYKI